MKKEYKTPSCTTYKVNIDSILDPIIANSIPGGEGDNQFSKGTGGGGSSNMWEWMDDDDDDGGISF